jgi:hypothetical protein
MTMNSDSARRNKPAPESAAKDKPANEQAATSKAAPAATPAPATPATTDAKSPEQATTSAEPTTGGDTTGDGEDSKEKARRGIAPTMPMAILYRLAGKVTAVIHHPIDGTSYSETGKGEGSAKGALEDTGFRLASITLDGPAWLVAKVPADAKLIGYAAIRSFPLPVQTPET